MGALQLSLFIMTLTLNVRSIAGLFICLFVQLGFFPFMCLSPLCVPFVPYRYAVGTDLWRRRSSEEFPGWSRGAQSCFDRCSCTSPTRASLARRPCSTLTLIPSTLGPRCMWPGNGPLHPRHDAAILPPHQKNYGALRHVA